MLAADRLLPAAASAGVLLLTPAVTPGFTATVCVPIRDGQARTSRSLVDVRSLMIEQGVFVTSAATAGHPDDIFTAADMAVLAMVDHARAVDDLDYSGLFDYDDD